MMKLELDELYQLMEEKKQDHVMKNAASMIQKNFRVFMIKKFCFQLRMKKQKCALKL